MGGSSSTQVPKEDLAFLLANTSFSKPQIKQWYKGFMVWFYSVWLVCQKSLWKINTRYQLMLYPPSKRSLSVWLDWKLLVRWTYMHCWKWEIIMKHDNEILMWCVAFFPVLWSRNMCQKRLVCLFENVIAYF